MIKLQKGEEPAILAENAAAWTSAIVEKMALGSKPTQAEKGRYNQPQIKQALVTETHGKCAYCESKLRHVAYGDIEHVVPKSSDPNVWFAWANLTLACGPCNTKKSNAPVNGDTFIDPYSVDPEEHFWQVGALVKPKPGSDAAALTENLLELNRTELLERRTERLEGLMKMLEVVERCASAPLKTILWDDFCREGEPQREYAALSRFVVALAKDKLGY